VSVQDEDDIRVGYSEEGFLRSHLKKGLHFPQRHQEDRGACPIMALVQCLEVQNSPIWTQKWPLLVSIPKQLFWCLDQAIWSPTLGGRQRAVSFVCLCLVCFCSHVEILCKLVLGHFLPTKVSVFGLLTVTIWPDSALNSGSLLHLWLVLFA
jgi:hypothetical protein